MFTPGVKGEEQLRRKMDRTGVLESSFWHIGKEEEEIGARE